MDQPFCFECVFFVPTNAWHNELTPDQWDESLEGECRCRCPYLGPVLKDRYGDTERYFGEWPKVMACDWCGQYIRRTTDDKAPTPSSQGTGPKAQIPTELVG